MEQTKKQEYETPQVEMLNARVEKGFAGSGMTPQTNTSGSTEELTSSGQSLNGNDFD